MLTGTLDVVQVAFITASDLMSVCRNLFGPCRLGYLGSLAEARTADNPDFGGLTFTDPCIGITCSLPQAIVLRFLIAKSNLLVADENRLKIVKKFQTW